MLRKLSIICLLIAAVISCNSIKEDRSKCPCWCSVDFSLVDSSIESLHLWFFDNTGRLLCRDTVYSWEYGDFYEVELNRGDVRCYIWGNLLDNTLLNDNSTLSSSLLKAEKCDADPLYFCSKILDAGGETCCDTVLMKKEHAVVDIQLKGGYTAENGLYIKLKGGTLGHYVNGSFIKESFYTYSYPHTNDFKESCFFRFRLMRQEVPEELYMTIYTMCDGKEVEIKDCPLGKWLVASGYDMKAEELSDVSLILDISLGFVSISTEDWETTVPVKIEL